MRFSVLILSFALSFATHRLQAQSFLGASSVAANADDRLEVFAIGADGACWHAWQGTPGGAWTSYVSLGGSLVGTPSAIINFDGRLELFALGTNGTVYHNWQTSAGGGWSGWYPLPGMSMSASPKAALNYDNRVEVFVKGTDNAVWHASQAIPGGAMGAWSSLGGGVADSPSVALNSNGNLEIFALEGNGAYHNFQLSPGGPAGWSGWISLGGSLASTPTVGQNDDGRLEIFAQGTDNGLWHAWQLVPGGGWTGWGSLGGSVQGSPSVILNGSVGLEIFAYNGGASYYNYQTSPDGGWAGFSPLGGYVLAAPSVEMNFDGRLEIFGQNGNIYHNWQSAAGAGGWVGWQLLTTASNTGTTNGADLSYLWSDSLDASYYSASQLGCQNPNWLVPGTSAAWACGARVNISVAGYKKLQPFNDAVKNWNTALSGYYSGGVPVQLFIGSGGPQRVSVYKVSNTSIPGNAPNTYGRGVTANRTYDSAGRQLTADIKIIAGMKYKDTLRNTLAHELGHTFGLADCNQCSTNGRGVTVMDTGEPAPGGSVWPDYLSMNFTEGLPGPTRCDLNVVQANMSYTSCIQASSAPPPVPGCANGAVAGFADGGLGSTDYTCGGNPCTGCNSSCTNFAPGPCPDGADNGGSSSPCGSLNVECADGVPVCTSGNYWACSVGAPCDLPEPAPCYPGAYNICTTEGWECIGSPIILDPFLDGFHFTTVATGVEFRLSPSGALHQMSWPDVHYRNGWLALDRNGNGKIDDFTELFGSNTPQPPSDSPNGYIALAVFDDPNNGGNGNRSIDPGDSVYSHLLVWIDENHDGVSQPNELHTLSELGIFEIGLEFRDSPKVDKNGNYFRYASSVEDAAGNKHDLCYDVFVHIR